MISAPSGCGKTTVCDELLSRNDKMCVSVSATTRSRRGEEKEGVDYFFYQTDYFEEQIEKEHFLEWAKVFDNYYGTPKGPLFESVDQGLDCLLNIDVQGAEQVRRSLPDGIFIFLMPPSMQTLEERLRKRGTDSEEIIAKRLKEAEREMDSAEKYDYIVINDDLDSAVKTIESIITAEKSKVNRNEEVINDIRTT